MLTACDLRKRSLAFQTYTAYCSLLPGRRGSIILNGNWKSKIQMQKNSKYDMVIQDDASTAVREIHLESCRNPRDAL